MNSLTVRPQTEKNMKTTVAYGGQYRDNGKENGNHCSILGAILG